MQSDFVARRPLTRHLREYNVVEETLQVVLRRFQTRARSFQKMVEANDEVSNARKASD